MSSELDSLPHNPRKTAGVRRLGAVDIRQLRQAVAALPESVWHDENDRKTNRFGVLGSTKHILFRFVTNFLDWTQSQDQPLWEEWKRLIEPVLAEATADYGYARGAFPRIMLARMPAGRAIQPHRDTNPAAKWPHKIHVPIVTNPDVTFYVDGVGYHFPEGEAVEVNNMATHAVANRGFEPRIHLIFEYFDLDQPEPNWIAPLRLKIAELEGQTHAQADMG